MWDLGGGDEEDSLERLGNDASTIAEVARVYRSRALRLATHDVLASKATEASARIAIEHCRRQLDRARAVLEDLDATLRALIDGRDSVQE